MLVALLSLAVLQSCGQGQEPPVQTTPQPRAPADSVPTPQNLSIYGPYTIEELLDSIWSDTLRVVDGRNSIYYQHIAFLAHFIDSTKNDTAGLFPATTFNKIVVRQANAFLGDRGYEATFGEPSELSNAQGAMLLGLIRDPLSFDWGECGTWMPTARFEFKLNDKVVATLDDGCAGQFRTTDPRMKFGGLTGKSMKAYRALLNELAIKAE
jgi:hypothetical protein